MNERGKRDRQFTFKDIQRLITHVFTKCSLIPTELVTPLEIFVQSCIISQSKCPITDTSFNLCQYMSEERV